MDKNISKNLSSNYSKKLLDHVKWSATDAIKTISKRVIQKIAEATGDFNCNKIANRIMKVLKNSKQNKSDTITNENDKRNT